MKPQFRTTCALATPHTQRTRLSRAVIAAFVAFTLAFGGIPAVAFADEAPKDTEATGTQSSSAQEAPASDDDALSKLADDLTKTENKGIGTVLKIGKQNYTLSSGQTGEKSFAVALPSMSNSKADIYVKGLYSDSYFEQPSSTFNKQLAYSSICFAASTFNSNKYGEDYYAKSVNVRSFLQSIGCKDIEVNAGYKAKPMDLAPVGVAVGWKTIKVKGKEYKLLAVGVRGGNYEKEWAGNLRVGTTHNHLGFEQARDEVVYFISEYVKKHTQEGDHLKIWMTGYSRSGAVSNLAGYFLSNNLASRDPNAKADEVDWVFGTGYNPETLRNSELTKVTLSGRYITKDDLYCYPVNAPQGAPKYQADQSRDTCSGIHNLINPDDWIPQVAPAKWNFARYGTDHDITGTYAEGESFDNRSKSVRLISSSGMGMAAYRLAQIDENTTSSGLNFIPQYFSAKNAANKVIYKTVFFIPSLITGDKSEPIIVRDLDGKGNFYVNKGETLCWNQGRYYSEFIEFFTDALFGNNLSGDEQRVRYAEEYQESFEYLAATFMGMSLSQSEKLNAALDKSINNVFYYKIRSLLHFDEYLANDCDRLKTSISRVISGTLDDLGVKNDTDKTQMACNRIVDIITKLYDKEQSLGSLTFYHLVTLVKNGNYVAQAHCPDVNIAWFDSAAPASVREIYGELADEGEMRKAKIVYSAPSTAANQDESGLETPDPNVAMAPGDEGLASTHEICMRVNGGNVGTYAVRKTGEVLGVLPVPDDVDLGDTVIESWNLYSGDGRLLKENLTENYVITDDDPAVMYMQANTRNLAWLPLRLYANKSGDYDKDELVAQFSVEENGFAWISDDEVDSQALGMEYYTAPSKQGYLFKGWVTAPDNDGNQIFYEADDDIDFEAMGANGLDLYAVWDDLALWQVKYHPNGGSPNEEVVQLDHNEDDMIAFAENSFERAGYTFAGWNTKADGTGTMYQPGSQASLSDLGLPSREIMHERTASLSEDQDALAEQYAKEGTVDLYAIWKASSSKSPSTSNATTTAKTADSVPPLTLVALVACAVLSAAFMRLGARRRNGRTYGAKDARS